MAPKRAKKKEGRIENGVDPPEAPAPQSQRLRLPRKVNPGPTNPVEPTGTTVEQGNGKTFRKIIQ